MCKRAHWQQNKLRGFDDPLGLIQWIEWSRSTWHCSFPTWECFHLHYFLFVGISSSFLAFPTFLKSIWIKSASGFWLNFLYSSSIKTPLISWISSAVCHKTKFSQASLICLLLELAVWCPLFKYKYAARISRRTHSLGTDGWSSLLLINRLCTNDETQYGISSFELSIFSQISDSICEF